MRSKSQIIRPDAEEDFAKEFPTRNPNPEDLLYLQGYEGETLRALAIAATDSGGDDENNFFPLLKEKDPLKEEKS